MTPDQDIDLIGIFSRTGTKTTLKAAKKARWWIMVSAAGVWRTEDFEKWVAENGAYNDFQEKQPFSVARFVRFLAWVAAEIRAGRPPQWIVLPDIVCGGEDSLNLSMNWLRWLRRCAAFRGQTFMLCVQNGMDTCKRMLARIKRVIGPKVGIFVGGDSNWKEVTARFWCQLARSVGGLSHVGRVNTARRIEIVGDAGAHSFDGTSVTRFPKTLQPLDRARRNEVIKRAQIDMFPERLAA
jgi:hypothetical protein